MRAEISSCIALCQSGCDIASWSLVGTVVVEAKLRTKLLEKDEFVPDETARGSLSVAAVDLALYLFVYRHMEDEQTYEFYVFWYIHKEGQQIFA